MISNVPRGSYLDERISKAYGKEVLLSNWQELRQGSNEQNDCILPGLMRVNACEKHLSEVKDNYTPPFTIVEAGEAARNYLDTRNGTLHNCMRNREVQVRFPLASDMINNYTTTYKIMYEILPNQELKKAAENPCVVTVPVRPQSLDLMLSYGSLNSSGKQCRQQAELRLDKIQRLQTTYAAEYDLAATIFRTLKLT